MNLFFQQVHYDGLERFGESKEAETSKIEVRQGKKVEIGIHEKNGVIVFFYLS